MTIFDIGGVMEEILDLSSMELYVGIGYPALRSGLGLSRRATHCGHRSPAGAI